MNPLQRVAVAVVRMAPVGVLVVGVLLRFADLDQAQLFRDEAASWILASYPLGSVLQHNVDKAYPPLYGLLLHGWMRIFGTGEATLRNPSAIAGVVTLIAAWRWTHEALGRTGGTMAASVVAVSTVLIANSREARMYSLETAFATVAWWLAWRLAADSKRLANRPVWHAHLTTALLFLVVVGEVWTLNFGLAVAGLQFLFVLSCLGTWRIREINGEGRVRGPGLALVAVLLGAASLSVWLPSLLAVPLSGQSFWTPRPNLGSLLGTFWDFLGASGRADLSAAAPIAAMVLLVAGIVGMAVPGRLGLAAARPRNSAIDSEAQATDDDSMRVRLFGLAACLGTGLVFVVWLYSQMEPVYNTRYLGAAVVPLAGLMAVGLIAITRSIRGRIFAAVLALAVVAPMTCGALQFVNDLNNGVGADPGRQTAQRLLSLVRPGDVVLTLDAQTYFPIDYYLVHTAGGSKIEDVLYDWDPPGEPFFVGTSLVGKDRVVSPALVSSVGWEAAMPGLHAGGKIWLVTVTAGDQKDLGFAPLDSGSLTELTKISVYVSPPQGGVGQIHALVPRPFFAPPPVPTP